MIMIYPVIKISSFLTFSLGNFLQFFICFVKLAIQDGHNISDFKVAHIKVSP